MYVVKFRKYLSNFRIIPSRNQHLIIFEIQVIKIRTKTRKTACCETYTPKNVWEVKTNIIQCIHLCFCMLAISFYFVNCVIISCKLSFYSRFTCNQIPIMSFLGSKKAELGCKMSELHLYVVKRQNWVVIIRK